MAWDDEMVAIVRTMVNDTSDTPTYSDDRLEGALVVAARLVNMELDFPVDYKANASAGSITPDPTVTSATAARDENFINLVCVKAACVIDRGSAILAAGQAILVKDGTSLVDLRDTWKAKLGLLSKGWCAVYEQLKAEYAASQQEAAVGAAILAPFRLYSGFGGDQPFYTGYDPRWQR